MSLVRIALRICAVQALRGKTLVGDNVLDSEIGALETTADGALKTTKDRPFISVYTDDSKVKDGHDLRSFCQNGQIEIVFEAGIATPHLVTNDDTDQTEVMNGLPATDAAFEFHLDMVMRQIGGALTDPKNEWAEIFRNLIVSNASYQRSRISGDTNGVRLAAHQLRVTANIVADPSIGFDLPTAMARFFEKCERDLVLTDPGVATKVSVMRAMLSGSEGDLDAAMRRYGMTHSEADAMLLTPVEG